MTKRDTRWITTTLASCTASTGPQLLALSLLMPEITRALNATVPKLGQLNTAFSIVSTIGAIIMGALTVRYPPKRLLLAGITTLLLSVTLASISGSFTQILAAFLLYGVGLSLTIPNITILLTLYPPEERTKALGRIYSGRSVTSIIATPIIGALATTYGWRTGYIGFGAPLMILAIILVATRIPEQPTKQDQSDLLSGFRNIAKNRSALACLAGTALSLAFFNSLMVFNGSYLRTTLGIPLDQASIAMSLTFIAVGVGQIMSGALAERIGVKTATWLSALIGGITLLSYFSLPLPIPIAIAASIIGTGMAGTTMTTTATLSLEQEPESRGTMMSLNSAAMSVGSMLSTVIGGTAINAFGWTGYGVTMFTVSLASVLVYYAWTREA